MKTIGIKELQTNPAKLTRPLEADEFTLITKRSRPIGIAISFNDEIVTEGLKRALMIDAYRKGLLSLGQVADALGQKKAETMKMLSAMGVDVIEYDFDDELKGIERLL